MKSDRVNIRDDSRRVLTYFGSLCLGLAVFAGTASLGAKDDLSSIASAGDSREALRAPGLSSTTVSSSKDSVLAAGRGNTATPNDEWPGRQRKAAPVPGQPDQDSSDPPAVELATPNRRPEGSAVRNRSDSRCSLREQYALSDSRCSRIGPQRISETGPQRSVMITSQH